MKVEFDEWEDKTPYLCIESYNSVAGGSHHYGTLYFRQPNGDVEKCDVYKMLTSIAAKRLNRHDPTATRKHRPGELTHRMDTIEETEAHARRTARAIWGWEGEIERCRRRNYAIEHFESKPGVFVQLGLRKEARDEMGR